MTAVAPGLRPGRFLFALCLAGLAGCAAPPPPAPRHDGPIVLVTFDALRADVVGALGGPPGLTPQLDGLAAEADWVGRGIAASSWGVPALASLSTGLQAWQHGAIHAGCARLDPALTTFPEALRAAGYRTLGYLSGTWASARFGYDQGFDRLRDLGLGNKAEGRLTRLAGRELVWLHVPEPQAPYRRRDRFLSRLPDAPPDLPRRLDAADLERLFDPARPLAAAERRTLWALYRLNVAWADMRLGRLLSALRRSGHWDRTLLVVTATHGEAFGEHGIVGHGGDLGREVVEVPLLVKLPRGFARRLAPPPAERVATTRLWATLVEAVGGQPLPGAAPSLFRRAPSPVLSELYLTNGSNRFSLVDGDLQLLWEARFAPPEPGYYAARLASLTGGGGPAARALFGRLRRAFDATPPLWGYGRPALRLERWGERGTVVVDDPARRQALAAALAAAFRRAAPDELTPGEATLERGASDQPMVEHGGVGYTARSRTGPPRVHSSAVRASGS
jgi:arylsulfatase